MSKKNNSKAMPRINQQWFGSAHHIKRPEVNIQGLLAEAVRLHQSGELKSAKAIYENILTAHPWHIDALHLLGILAHQTGNDHAALQLIDKAISLNSKTAIFFNSRGLVLNTLTRYQEALTSFDKAIEINPMSAEAYCNRGNTLKALNEPEKALVSVDAAIEADPYYHLAFFNKGILLEESGKSQVALDHFNQATAIKHDYAEAYCAKGNSLLSLQRYPEAIAEFDKAIFYKSDLAQAFCNRGIALQRMHHYQRALADMNHGIFLQPKNSQSYFNRGVLEFQMQDFASALKSYDKAIEMEPQNSDAHFNKSLLHLSQKNFEQGWQLYEWRFVKPGQAQARLETTLPLWDPSNASHKRVIIWGEQGVGDQILFGTLLPEAKDLIQDLTVMIDTRLIPLFERSLKGVNIIGMNELVEDENFDAHMPLMSLGGKFRVSESRFPKTRSPFLITDSSRCELLRDELGNSKNILCGVAWKSKEKKYGKAKSMSLYDLLPVLEIPGITFINLQYGETDDERAEFEKKTGIKIHSCRSVDNFNDLDGHAALTQVCDFIVMTSNSTAHVAGALGKETYVAISGGQGALWYWENQFDGHCLWYPTVQIFRQSKADDWGLPVEQIREAVEIKIHNLGKARDVPPDLSSA